MSARCIHRCSEAGSCGCRTVCRLFLLVRRAGMRRLMLGETRRIGLGSHDAVPRNRHRVCVGVAQRILIAIHKAGRHDGGGVAQRSPVQCKRRFVGIGKSGIAGTAAQYLGGSISGGNALCGVPCGTELVRGISVLCAHGWNCAVVERWGIIGCREFTSGERNGFQSACIKNVGGGITGHADAGIAHRVAADGESVIHGGVARRQILHLVGLEEIVAVPTVLPVGVRVLRGVKCQEGLGHGRQVRTGDRGDRGILNGFRHTGFRQQQILGGQRRRRLPRPQQCQEFIGGHDGHVRSGVGIILQTQRAHAQDAEFVRNGDARCIQRGCGCGLAGDVRHAGDHLIQQHAQLS